MIARAFSLWFCLSGIAAIAAGEQPSAAEIVGVRVGFAGVYKAGLWTPVQVTLRGGSRPLAGRVRLTLPDGEGVASRVSTPADELCRVPAGGDAVVELCARFGRVNGSLQVELESEGEIVAQTVLHTASKADAGHFLPAIEAEKLIVAVGSPALDQVVAASEPTGQAVMVRLDNAAVLPTKWYGYEGVDALILSTGRPEIYRALGSGGARLAALEEWVDLGGRLLVCVGSQGEKVLGGRSPLRRFVAGRFEKMVVLHQTAALETYCRSTTAMPAAAGPERQALRVPRLVELSGTVEAREADLPLVVRAPRGFGQTIFLAADLDEPPLSRWSRQDRGSLLSKLLDLAASQREETQENAPVMHFGYTDLAGQLRSALDRFEGVRAVPFGAVAGLIALYILLIGPADYFLLRKVARRMQWTWVTFSLVVLGFGLAAYLLAYALKGNEFHVHQVDLIDVDAASQRARGTTWANILSPRSESCRLSFEPRLSGTAAPRNARVLLSWLGLPGAALGGMNPRSSDAVLRVGQYDFAPRLDAIENLPLQVWSTRSFTARWTAQSAPCPAVELVEEGQILTGTITNTLDFPLQQAVLAYSGWAYELGTLRAGESAYLGPEVRRSELKTLLTGRKMVYDEKEKYHQLATPYDQSGTDVARILRMMMFFEAAGGQRYTGLSNDYQAFVDLSGLLKTDRVILVAQAPAGAATARLRGSWLRDGQPLAGPHDQPTVVYRFVIPLKSAKSG